MIRTQIGAYNLRTEISVLNMGGIANDQYPAGKAGHCGGLSGLLPHRAFPKPPGRRCGACAQKGLEVYEAQTTVENEKDMLAAVEEVTKAGCNALTVFLGNFGPETPETLIAKYFDGPCMFVAAAEGDGDLINGRGDAYCGMLNCSYNLGCGA